MTIELELFDLIFTVVGTKVKGQRGDYWTEPLPSYFHIDEIYLCDCEVSDVLKQNVIDKIAEECNAYVNNY